MKIYIHFLKGSTQKKGGEINWPTKTECPDPRASLPRLTGLPPPQSLGTGSHYFFQNVLDTHFLSVFAQKPLLIKQVLTNVF